MIASTNSAKLCSFNLGGELVDSWSNPLEEEIRDFYLFDFAPNERLIHVIALDDLGSGTNLKLPGVLYNFQRCSVLVGPC